MNNCPKNILVVRNDKLGDFMLAWPSFAALKQAFPDARIVALVPNYTRPIAELCPWIDEILIDPTESAGLKGLWAAIQGGQGPALRPDADAVFDYTDWSAGAAGRYSATLGSCDQAGPTVL